MAAKARIENKNGAGVWVEGGVHAWAPWVNPGKCRVGGVARDERHKANDRRQPLPSSNRTGGFPASGFRTPSSREAFTGVASRLAFALGFALQSQRVGGMPPVPS